jgi:hypothetical protein
MAASLWGIRSISNQRQLSLHCLTVDPFFHISRPISHSMPNLDELGTTPRRSPLVEQLLVDLEEFSNIVGRQKLRQF